MPRVFNILAFMWKRFPVFILNKPLLFISKGNYWLISSRGVSFYFVVPARDYLLHFAEPYEFYSKVKSGDVVFDVGASIGEQTVMYAKKVGRNGRVVAIEPSLERVSYLKRNIALNGLKNVELLKSAIWSSEGVTELRTNNLSCTVGPTGFQVMRYGSSGQVKVKTKTLDKIASDLGIEKIDFLKMDVEGSEVEALKGASLPIKSMAIETHKIGKHKTTHQVCQLLKKRHFRILVQYITSELDMVYASKP